MNDKENALGDRFKKASAPASSAHPLSPAEARAEAERRLHEAWLSETARQTAKIEEVAPAAPAAPSAPAAPATPPPDPRIEILGQSWETSSSEPKWVAPRESDWTIAQRAGGSAPQDQEWVRPREWNAAPEPQREIAPQAPQYVAPEPQYAAPQYTPQVPHHAAPQAPHYAAPQAPQQFTPVAPQRAPSFPPSDDATLRGGVVENLEFARQRVEELRKLQEWRLGQERRVSEEIGRRNALAEAALAEDLQARREAEEHRLEQWKAEARTQFERDLAREEAEFERRLADRRRDAEVELEARLLRRIDDAARRAEALEKGRLETPDAEPLADPRLYVVRNAV